MNINRDEGYYLKKRKISVPLFLKLIATFMICSKYNILQQLQPL